MEREEDLALPNLNRFQIEDFGGSSPSTALSIAVSLALSLIAFAAALRSLEDQLGRSDHSTHSWSAKWGLELSTCSRIALGYTVIRSPLAAPRGRTEMWASLTHCFDLKT